jgi:hypothetical protein
MARTLAREAADLRAQRAALRRQLDAVNSGQGPSDAFARILTLDQIRFALDRTELELAKLHKYSRAGLIRDLRSLVMRSIDADQREFEGVASTSSLDLMGDEVIASGMRCHLPIPVLLSHNHDRPVGRVHEARVAGDAIRVRGRIAKVSSPRSVRELVDHAWGLIRSQLIDKLSIGFVPIHAEALPRGGRRFTSWWLTEVSLVATPANLEARRSLLPAACRWCASDDPPHHA